VFPFLIGTVRTWCKSRNVRNSVEVSIPHRYGKNFDSRLEADFYLRLFPFLIGTVRTQLWQRYLDLYLVVSIPHRYGKNTRGLAPPKWV